MTVKFTLVLNVESYDDIIKVLRSEADSWESISNVIGDRYDLLTISTIMEAPVYTDKGTMGDWSLEP